MYSRILTCLGLLCLPAYLSAHQEKPSTAAASAEAPIVLDVVARDKSGGPVSGLTTRDFTVLDNGRLQEILQFQAKGAGDPGVEVVLVVDSVNMPFSRVAYGQGQIEKFLQRDGGRLSRPITLAFFSDKGMEIQRTSSEDGNALRTALQKHETALRTIRRSSGFYGAADRQRLSLQALAEITEFERTRPGRKIVVWLSPGWPLLSGPEVELSSKSQGSLFNEIVAMRTQLRESRITLYSLDPLGTEDAGGFRTFYYESFLKPVTAPRQVQFGNLGLQVLAVQSGGKVFNSSNDVAGEIAACVRDGSAYYELSFRPQQADGPNDYHAIQVKVAEPQVKAQTLEGYYAQPPH